MSAQDPRPAAGCAVEAPPIAAIPLAAIETRLGCLETAISPVFMRDPRKPTEIAGELSDWCFAQGAALAPARFKCLLLAKARSSAHDTRPFLVIADEFWAWIKGPAEKTAKSPPGTQSKP